MWTQQNVGTGITNRWSVRSTNYAGGQAYEMRCAYQDIDPATTRLVTPPIDTTGHTSLRLSFKHYLNAYSDGCTLKVQTSPDGTTWTDEAWMIESTDINIGPETVDTVLAHNLDIETTYVAFVITGDLYAFDYWYIDDVEISGEKGAEDLLATWDGQGVYYRNSETGAWVKLASPATMIACGDMDEDGIDDIIGLVADAGRHLGQVLEQRGLGQAVLDGGPHRRRGHERRRPGRPPRDLGRPGRLLPELGDRRLDQDGLAGDADHDGRHRRRRDRRPDRDLADAGRRLGEVLEHRGLGEAVVLGHGLSPRAT